MNRRFVVLMAEDDEHDVIATRRAWTRGAFASELRIVSDGEECLDYLWQRGRYSAPGSAPRPDLVLLDLHMPRLDGLQTLAQLRASEPFGLLPVVVLTTSRAEEDRARSYALGANAYLVKPVGFEQLVAALKAVDVFWRMVEPAGGHRESA